MLCVVDGGRLEPGVGVVIELLQTLEVENRGREIFLKLSVIRHLKAHDEIVANIQALQIDEVANGRRERAQLIMASWSAN